MSTTQFVTVPQGRISFDDTGDDSTNSKPICICLPGIGDLRSSYRFLSKYLADDGFRVIQMDIRGLGESTVEWDSFAPHSVGEDVIALIKQLNISSDQGVLILGNSMTAASAVWVATELPETVKGIILLGPFVRDAEISGFTKLMLKILLGGFWGRAAWKSFYKSLYKSNPPADLNEHSEKIHSNLCESGRHTALYKQLFESKQRCTDRIKDLKSPALVVMGSKDPDFSPPESEVKWIENQFHGLATSVMIEGAGHYPHIEYPEKVYQSIKEFFNDRVKH